MVRRQHVIAAFLLLVSLFGSSQLAFGQASPGKSQNPDRTPATERRSAFDVKVEVPKDQGFGQALPSNSTKPALAPRQDERSSVGPKILEEQKERIVFVRSIATDKEKAQYKSEGTIDQLPKHVEVEDKKITLFADYARPIQNQTPVYIVNRTGKALYLHAEDGDVYLKLEYEEKPLSD